MSTVVLVTNFTGCEGGLDLVLRFLTNIVTPIGSRCSGPSTVVVTTMAGDSNLYCLILHVLLPSVFIVHGFAVALFAWAWKVRRISISEHIFSWRHVLWLALGAVISPGDRHYILVYRESPGSIDVLVADVYADGAEGRRLLPVPISVIFENPSSPGGSTWTGFGAYDLWGTENVSSSQCRSRMLFGFEDDAVLDVFVNVVVTYIV